MATIGGPAYEHLDTTVSTAVRAGVVVVRAAGNAKRGGTTPLAITVAASDIEDEIASLSYYGRLSVETELRGPQNYP
ncbi:hypothetical protein B0T25DRAFT_563416 [Lasiosphaeria hispida]|uniref:Peptidase S8/S53 domain-containing protein n=1 Tax=Lasiosphaeria hispida TaxID=260671 RepID=A0AAJ0HXA5_9PEZI|nr:hypothetical protein B0T25DRAFT_563416 [Lasiosphaeria hispida]